jgi:hypothetical protein
VVVAAAGELIVGLVVGCEDVTRDQAYVYGAVPPLAVTVVEAVVALPEPEVLPTTDVGLAVAANAVPPEVS